MDTDLLDIMMTWDQLSTGDAKPQQPESKPDNRSTADWMHDTSVFSVEKLQKGTFSHLPAANVEEMFKRMTSLAVRAGQTIIQQGAEGDYYYLIEKGTAAVTKRMELGQPPVLLAELNAGSAFGEEALVSDNKRNATVTMNTAGELLRLSKKDFVELLKEPLLTQLSYAEAQVRVSSGAVWADVRLPSEFNFDHLQGAINLPLNEIRSVATGLDKTKTYVLYCQTGRRSSAAAFVLTQLGFEVLVLKGGTRANGL